MAVFSDPVSAKMIPLSVRIELTTSRLTVERANQLRHESWKTHAFLTGNRTPVYRELHGCNLEASFEEPVDDRR